jgi:hypothetical protein
MRGFPILRIALVVVALVLLAVPVWSLTRSAPPAVVKPTQLTSSAEKPADYLVVLTSSNPARLQAMAANLPAASSENGARRFQTVFPMSPDEPEDIAVFADFEDRANPSALHARVEKNGVVLVEKTFWGTGLVEDVVMIPAQ